ncbi:hypothetical protein ACN4EE_00830 [Geminocystis sp. CENA526]|uniref:hypothetical protein n=1 Tax=Geminocystis sp. CENA526 TaxID=1355871 RepID=UPI003D6E5A58
MLSTDIKQESMVKKITNTVDILREEYPIYKKSLDYSETLLDLVDAFQRNLSFEEFNAMSDEKLKKHCRDMMAVRLLGNIGDSFTPEEMIIFEDAIKRK